MISDEVVKTAEEKYKEALFDGLQTMYQKQDILISEINKLKQYGFDTNLPNIGTTLNNKVVELANIFKEAGTSLYIQKFEDYGALSLDFLGASFMGQVITSGLLDSLMEANNLLGKVIECEVQSTQRREKEILERQKASPIAKFFSRIKSIFVPKLPEPLYTEQEQNQIKSFLNEYKEADKKIFDFTLKDGIIQSIVKYIRKKDYHVSNIPGLLEEAVYPDLEKLGLSDLIPELQKTLIEEYKKDMDPEMKVSQENMYLYVPDFNRGEGTYKVKETSKTAKETGETVKKDKKEVTEKADKTEKTEKTEKADESVKSGKKEDRKNDVKRKEKVDPAKLDEFIARVHESIAKNNALVGEEVIKEHSSTGTTKSDKDTPDIEDDDREEI